MRAFRGTAAAVLTTAMLILGLVLPGSALAGVRDGFVSVGSGERIGNYQADYVLAKDGSVKVTETITHIFPTGEERHGITRDIRVRAGYKNRDDVYRYYRLSGLSVSSPSGAPAQVSRDDYGAYIHLRIGSPDKTVSGTQTYVINYTLAHVVNEIDATHAEFVQDVVAASNSQHYDTISATIAAPTTPLQAACNYGPVGSESLCQSKIGNPSTFSHNDLEPGQAMSIAVSMDRAAFGDLSPELIKGSTDNEDSGNSTVSPHAARLLSQLAAGLGLFFPFLAAAGMAMLVWTRGRDEAYAGLTPGLAPGVGEEAATVRQTRPGTVAVQFNPPPGVQPGMVGTLIDEEANTVDVTATILDLAVRGYLTITETENSSGRTDWLLDRTNPPQAAQALTTYEQMLLDALVAAGTTVRLSDLKNSFASTLSSVQSSMYEEVVRRGWFRRSPQSQRNTWSGFGSALQVVGVIATFFLAGQLPSGPVASWLPINGVYVLAGGLVLSGVIVKVIGKRMAARTAEGSAVLAQSLGFKEYLVTAEAAQIKFEEAQQIFSKYLPYAIVFGVADKWAKTFDEVAAAAAAAGVTMASPTWYIGPDFGHGGYFDGIASAADSFSTQAAGTFVSTAGSSGDSVFSGGGGFSGGGFSGGGGSGSSGGSW